MSEMNEQQPGSLIQAYVSNRWGRDPDDEETERLGARLDPELRERIDILGGDGQRLLDVDSEAVLAELERLELEAAKEDARVAASVARADARNGAAAPSKPKAKKKDSARRDAGARSGQPRKQTGQGRRRPRGKT